MKKNWKRLTAMMLCAAMVCNTGGMASLAKVVDGEPQAIERVVELAGDILHQQVPYGTRKAELNLPAKLKVIILKEDNASPSNAGSKVRFASPSETESESEGEKTVSVSVDWEVNPLFSVKEKYDGETPGIYVFEPVIKSGAYDAGSAELPQIEVEVQENTLLSGKKATMSNAIYPDAATADTWTGNEYGTVEVTEDGWLHLVSTAGNNGASQFYVTNENAVLDKTGTGFVEFTVKFNSSLADTRFGVYLFSGGPMLGQFVGYDSGSMWFWQTYSGGNDYGSLGLADVVAEESKVRIDYADGKAKITVNGKTSKKDVDLTALAEDNTALAFKAARYPTNDKMFDTDVMLKDIHYTGQDLLGGIEVSGTVTDEQNKPVKGARITTDQGMSAVTDEEGRFSGLQMTEGDHEVTVSAEGYLALKETVTVTEDVLPQKFVLKTAPLVSISSETMDVALYENYPAVRQYTMKGNGLEGEAVSGSMVCPNTITINGHDVVLEEDSVTCRAEGGKAVYTLSIPEAEGRAACKITVEITADGNILTMKIPDVEYVTERTAANAIQSIQFPNQKLVSVSSAENGTFAGSNMSSHTLISGDTFENVTDMEAGSKAYMYAFVSNDKVSAAVESNSEATGKVVYNYGIGGGSNNTRLVVTTDETADGGKSTGIGSNVFYWNRVETAKVGNGDPSDTKDYITEPTEKPLVKVILTGDRNKDEKVDWQDGAIAFREISHEIYKSEEVPDRVAMRIVENFSSQATNPFLLTLDNAKRVYLNTDGLGQSILLKGYANEGHDSGHPDYYDINKRAGGVKDFKTMLEDGEEMGAKFGIHVNASEMYPEAKAFDEDLVKRSGDNLSYGWNWLDQGIGIDSRFDLVSGRREERFDKLHEALGGDGEDKLDFIYVDVWGNGTGTLEDSWATRRLTDEITDNGWRMATEWGMGNEYDATFQHWAADLTYGDQRNKGYNSMITRFIRNQQKDSWVADYPKEFGGASNAPLLGGYNQQDFEGWAKRNNYDNYITNLFTYDISTKFLQHFTVSQWERDTTKSVVLTSKLGEDYTWIPDSFVKLEGEYGDITITRGGTDYSIEVDSDYRDRTITLNGKEILRGHLTQADTGKTGDEMYLIPWFWDADGSKLDKKEQKLYHWNTSGETSTWELPDEWEGLGSVYLYELTDQGRTNKTEVPVIGNEITLNVKSATPYVVYKGEAAPLEVDWKSSHVWDAGFNSYSLDAWTVSGDVQVIDTSYGNPVMRMGGGSDASQTITDLVPGTRYALYLAVDNRSESDFIMEVTGADQAVLGSNRTGKSIAKNYVGTDPHNWDYGMSEESGGYTQNMYVFFTADSETAVLHLSRVNGTDYTYMDNLRVVESEAKNGIYDENGDLIEFKQDFENVAQGLYPFVMGSATDVSDTRVHLSELHDPYTQAGWDVKKGDDVLDGSWSLKANGQTEKNRFVYQTVPQNIYFKPGYTYHVSFDYQVGSEDTYGVIIGDGETFSISDIQLLPHMEDEETGEFITQTYEFDITGAADGLTWFGLFSTSTPADTRGLDPKNSYENDVINFSGYKDLVLDNLSVVRTDSGLQTREELEALIAEAEANYKEKDYSPEVWARFRMALAQAKAVLVKDVSATRSEIMDACNLLTANMKALDAYEGMPADFAGMDIQIDGITATAGSHHSGEGPENAVDGDEGTLWHTEWGYDSITNGDNWIKLELPEAIALDGIRYLPRSGGGNGNILKMRVEVSEDGENWTAVNAPDGGEAFVFEKNDSWKKASFKRQEKIRFIRITGLETDGNSAVEVNFYVSAREIRLTDSSLYTPEPLPVDTSTLLYVMNQSKKLTESLYTPETWSVLKEKLEAAEAAKDSNDYDAVALALANLTDAVKGLEAATEPEPVPVDKSELKRVVDEYSALTQGNYSDGSWKAFREALQAAKAVLNNEEATAADVEKAVITLKNAKASLVEKPAVTDKEALRSLVKQYEAMTNDNYTENSWKAFADALAAAKLVLADDKATDADVNAAMTALKTAAANLEKETTKPEKESSDSSSGSSSSETAITYPALSGSYPSAEATGTWNHDTPGVWQFTKADGSLAKDEWLKINGTWYLFGSSSTMMTDWVQVNGIWYYLDPVNGDMKTGWQLINSVWYYLEPANGTMRTGWVEVDGKWYYLDQSGKMLASATTPDGYQVDASGAWIQ